MPSTSTQGVHFFPRRMYPSRFWPLRMFPAIVPGYFGPAVPVENWAMGGQPVFEGDADFVALMPVTEPVSVGPPPVAPSVVRRVSVGFDVRSVGSRAGYVVTSALDPSSRARYLVNWRGLTKAERDDLLAFFRDEVQVSEAGGRFGFDLEPDGAGHGAVVVRPMANVTHLWGQHGGDAAGEAGGSVHSIEGVECEELYVPGSGAGGLGSGSGIGGGGGGGGDVDDGDDGSDVGGIAGGIGGVGVGGIGIGIGNP